MSKLIPGCDKATCDTCLGGKPGRWTFEIPGIAPRRHICDVCIYDLKCDLAEGPIRCHPRIQPLQAGEYRERIDGTIYHHITRALN